MNYRAAVNADLADILNILCVNKLPYEDCEQHLENFFVAEEKWEFIAVGGLEFYGEVGLVRSIAVTPEFRGRGVAKNIYKLIENRAVSLGAKELYLLTESAAEYFLQLGFSVRGREQIPLQITGTKQFKTLCPKSAVIMSRKV